MKSSEKKQKKKKDRAANILFGVAAVLVLGLIVYVWTRPGPPPESFPTAVVQKAAQVQTLDPAMFSGKTRESYQAAKDVPEVLAQVGCYCGCMKNSGHEHNLHCFTDSHGAT